MADLIRQLEDDAARTGYPSELRAAKIFSARQWSFAGNSYFVDPVDAKGREIDVQAHTSRQLVIPSKDPEAYELGPFFNPSERPVSVWSFISAEVKKSDKPWVVFASKKDQWGDLHPRLLSHRQNVKNLLSWETPKANHPSIGTAEYIGRTGYIAFKGDESSFFGAVVVAAKAALATFKAASEHGEVWNESSTDVVHYTPVVIVDAPLFQAVLVKEDMVFEPIHWIPYRLNIVFGESVHSPEYGKDTYIVDIVGLAYLDSYLAAHERWIERMFDEICKRRSRAGRTKPKVKSRK